MLQKIVESKASDICARCTLPDSATGHLQPGMTPAGFVDALIEGKEYLAGIDFLAHALPPREAVWWACLCIQHAFGEALAGKEREACFAAVQWVLRSNEEHRKIARTQADAAGPGCAAGMAAMAAAIGGETAAFTTGKAAGSAVKLASIKADPVRIADTQRRYIQLGLGVADGRHM